MYRHRAGIFLWRLGAGLYLTCLCFRNRSKIETSQNRDSTGWTSLKMLFGIERFTHSLEWSPACFLLKKSLLLEEEPGLVISRYIFFQEFDCMWTGFPFHLRELRVFAVAPSISSLISTSSWFFHTAEFWSPLTAVQGHCFAFVTVPLQNSVLWF